MERSERLALEGKVARLVGNAAAVVTNVQGAPTHAPGSEERGTNLKRRAATHARGSEERGTKRRAAEALEAPANVGTLTAAAVKKMKVAELREELTARGLDTKGLKPALVARLMREAS